MVGIHWASCLGHVVCIALAFGVIVRHGGEEKVAGQASHPNCSRSVWHDDFDRSHHRRHRGSSIAIAQADAIKAYHDLSPYRIHIVLEADGWHVDYHLKEPLWKGGGPHYVIDVASGAIVSKRYEQ